LLGGGGVLRGRYVLARLLYSTLRVGFRCLFVSHLPSFSPPRPVLYCLCGSVLRAAGFGGSRTLAAGCFSVWRGALFS
jgi:hypothetical protein